MSLRFPITIEPVMTSEFGELVKIRKFTHQIHVFSWVEWKDQKCGRILEISQIEKIERKSGLPDTISELVM